MEWAMHQWEEPSTGRLLASLRRQACHGDANEMNILVSVWGQAAFGNVKAWNSVLL